MYREAIEFLNDWKDRTTRKPLIIRGARQVGKTFLIEQFADDFEFLIKINFEENPEYKDFFITNDVQDIVKNISLALGTKIEPGKTLLFLDEIQFCPEAIPTLRYFYEKIPDLHVIAAGSLLDHVLNEMNYSMPVGRVEFMYMYPLNFREFLLAIGENMIVDFLSTYQHGKVISSVVHSKLLKLLRTYFFIGGMPEAIKVYIETSDLLEVERVHESILTAMEIDFTKYSKNNFDHLRMVLRYVPRGLGKKFKYSNVSSSIRAESIKTAFQKLQLSRVVHRVSATSSANIPLMQHEKENVFKPLFFDIGLVSHLLKIRLINLENLMLANEGDLAEQFIGQQLLTQKPFFIDKELFYWNREKRDSSAELDFLFEMGNKVIPIEVKAGKTGTLKSLHVFMLEKQKDLAVRFNADLPSLMDVSTTVKMANENQQVGYKLMSLPLYLVNFMDQITELKE
ncbi:MAG: AAA family ATPase [Bacteroidales bacterium]|nr:AAA family ATPase [Bacteroidales bacterium]MCF8458577.1 AAA family ATPase [Bacteroidales bacterium]